MPRSSPQTLDALAALLATRGKLELTGDAGSVLVPREIVKLLRDAVSHLGAGDAVSVVALRREVTTGEAARILGLSRQHIVRMIDAGRLPARVTRAGRHRRVSMADLLRIKEKRELDAARAEAIGKFLDDLAAARTRS
jgi:excisionase family DNA binding protein